MRFSVDHIVAEYRRLDQKCNVHLCDVPIKITNAVRRCGSCLTSSKNVEAPVRRITIASFVLDSSEEEFLDTIRHEYAHALVAVRYPGERHCHDAVWKAACLEVGCNPARCAKATQQTMLRYQKNVKYVVRCNCCGQTWRYLRAGKTVSLLQKGERLICPLCNGDDFSLKNSR